MANTYINPGLRIPYTNSGGAITSGTPVVLVTGNNGCIGIAVNDIAATTGTGEVEVEGVHVLACTGADTTVIGTKVYWTGTALTTTASTNTYVGRAAEVKGAGPTTLKVKLNGMYFA